MITEIPSTLELPPNFRYTRGRAGSYNIEFESDFDAAVFFAGKNLTGKSKGSKSVINWLKSYGIDLEEVIEHRKKLLEVIRNIAIEYEERGYDTENWEFEAPDRGPQYGDRDFRVPTLPNNFSFESEEDDDEEMPEGLNALLAEIVEDKVKKKKIDPTKLLGNKQEIKEELFDVSSIKNVKRVRQNPNISPLEKDVEKENQGYEKIITGIDTIISLLKSDKKFNEKIISRQKLKEERNRRKGREEKLEGNIKKEKNSIVENVKQTVDPLKNIIDRITGFFTKIFLGVAVVKLFKWFSDPKNKEKVESIGRFFKDWWPLLLSGYLLFGTKLGGFITSTVKLFAWAIPKLLKVSKLLGKGLLALGKNPLGMGAMLFGSGFVIPQFFPETVSDQADKDADAAVEEKGKEQAIADLRAQNENRNSLQKFGDFITGAGAEREEQIQRLETGEEKRYGFNDGGLVRGKKGIDKVPTIREEQIQRIQRLETGEEKRYGFNGGALVRGKKGIDKVPAMLSDGEVVINQPTVREIGAENLLALNRKFGGPNANKPKVMRGVTYANTGGIIGSADFDPVKYRENLISSRHIENPGNTGNTYVLGYNKDSDGSIVVKQINQVTEKAGPLGMLFGKKDKLTSVSPESDTWNTVLSSSNTKKYFSTTTGTSSGGDRVTKVPEIKTDPQAKIAYDYNDQYQETKNELISKGADEREAEINAAKISATKLTEGGVNVTRRDLGSGNSTADTDTTDPIVKLLMNSILGAAGIFPQKKSEEGSGESTSGNQSPTSEGSGGRKTASNPGVYPKQGKTMYLHWTAGGYNSVVGPYHTVFTGDGKKHRLVDYDKVSGHTYNRNSNSIGLSVAAMGGGSNESNMTQAPTELQLDAMATEAATLGKNMGWSSSDINIRNVMTHGEAGSNKDGRYMHDNYGPSVWGGTGERWDLDKLRKGQQIGEGGPEMRRRIAKKMMGIKPDTSDTTTELKDSTKLKAKTGGKIVDSVKPKIEKSQNKKLPQITPLSRSQSPKVTHLTGNLDTSGLKTQREVTSTEVPEINASTACPIKLQILGIIGI